MDSVRDALGSGRPQRCRSASGRDLSGAHTDMGAVRKRALASVRSKSRRAASLPDSVTRRNERFVTLSFQLLTQLAWGLTREAPGGDGLTRREAPGVGP